MIFEQLSLMPAVICDPGLVDFATSINQQTDRFGAADWDDRSSETCRSNALCINSIY